MKLKLPWLRFGRPAAPKPLVSTESQNRWPLSMKLLSWNLHDHVHLFDVLTGIQVWGATGSTKSTTTVEMFSKAFLANGFGAIYFAVKPDDPANYLRHAVECGREKDVILFGPGHPATFNFVDDGLGNGGAGLAANITSLLSIVSGLAGGTRSGKASGGREDGSFWEKLDNRLISAATLLLIRALQPVTTVNLERVVLALPRTREQVGEEEWMNESYLFRCLRDADRLATTDEDREDVVRLADYFLLDMAQIGEKLRATVQTSVGATLDLFNHSITRRLISSPAPSFRMEMLQEGKILLVNMPVMTYGVLARAIQACLKHCFQLAQNRRDVSANPRPVAMVCDEAQAIIDLEHDAAFACTARSTRSVCLYATQSISNYYAVSPGPQGEARVHSLLGNLLCQVAHQTTDTRMVEYLQSLFGKRKRLLMSGGTQNSGRDWVGGALGLASSGNSVNAGYAESMDFDIQAEQLQRLARGGPPDWISEALVFQGGKFFRSTGRPYLPVRFKQRPNAL